MKKMVVLVCMIALGFLLALAAFDDSSAQSAESEGVMAELEQLKAALVKTEGERDNLKVKAAVEQRDREQLQAKVDELTRSREQLQKQVEKFTFTCDQSRQQLAEIIKTRDELKKQVSELSDTRGKLQRQYDIVAASHNQLSKQVEGLTASRDEAVAKVQTAQKRIEMLVATPDSEKRESRERQERLTVTNKVQKYTQPPTVEIGKGLAIGSNGIHSRILLEQDTASGDSKAFSGQQPPVSDPSATLGKFLGYRARRDESGKLILVPVFENKQEE